MTAYTDVAKPTATSYTTLNKGGINTFDDSSITYDDPNTFYDGFNPNAYTNLAKPNSTVYTNISKPT